MERSDMFVGERKETSSRNLLEVFFYQVMGLREAVYLFLQITMIF